MKIKEDLSQEELISKIMEKKEFSKLIRGDVKRVFNKFKKEGFSNEEKIKLTRRSLKKIFSSFMGRRILSVKDKSPDWFLSHHVSTKERVGFYDELYSKLLKGGETIFDLGCGINGFSFEHFPKGVSYFGIEGVGQLVDLQNNWFAKEKKNALCYHESLFSLEKVKDILKKDKGEKILFLFKVVDGLEEIKKNYSKKFLLETVSLVDRVCLSFATRSLSKGTKFRANKKWLMGFIGQEFKILDEFELGNEKYVLFSKK